MFSIEVFRSWFLQVIFIWLHVLKISNFLITLSRKTTFLSSVSVRLQTVWVFTSIFITYFLAFRQFISRDKSSIHSREMSTSRLNILTMLTCFINGYMPFYHLGCLFLRICQNLTIFILLLISSYVNLLLENVSCFLTNEKSDC